MQGCLCISKETVRAARSKARACPLVPQTKIAVDDPFGLVDQISLDGGT